MPDADQVTPSANGAPGVPSDHIPAEGAPVEEAVEHVAVGRINSIWGVQGHVKVTAMTNNPDRLSKGAHVYVNGVPRTITDVRYPRGYPVVLFDGITTADEAETLRGALIEIDEEELPALPEGEYYVHDLIGLAVFTSDGRDLGRVYDVLRTGSNDVYVVRKHGQRDVLIPALEGVLLEVDLQGDRMVIEPVPGLLDEPS